LFEALTNLCKLIAPAMPFIADEIYRNLVGSTDPLAPISVHLADWPDFNPEVIDEGKIKEMSLVMRLVTLGHSARNKANLKVRQPLSEAAFAFSNPEDAKVIEKYADLLMEELNVKRVRNLMVAGEAVAYEVVPLPKQLGQKYKNQYPAVKKSILELPTEQAAKELLLGNSIKIKIGKEDFEILPNEVEVRLQAKPGYTVAMEGPLLAALVTELDENLIMEGLAREFVRHIQEARKQAALDIADRIRVAYTATDKLGRAIKAFMEYIKSETLALEMTDAAIPDELPNASDEFDGEQVTLWIERVDRT